MHGDRVTQAHVAPRKCHSGRSAKLEVRLEHFERPFPGHGKVLANRKRLKNLSVLAASFFVGGVAGALGFKHAGYASTVPLALVLVALACVPALDDLGRLTRPGATH